ncbi:hypothetical protein GC209_19290 [bacterium]|nr:hypothetical protein [bacterium]
MTDQQRVAAWPREYIDGVPAPDDSFLFMDSLTAVGSGGGSAKVGLDHAARRLLERLGSGSGADNAAALVAFALQTGSAMAKWHGGLTGEVLRQLFDHLADRSPSVLTFGADPTGVTDSTAAFQKAADLGMIIIVPPGTYVIGAGNARVALSAGSGFVGQYPGTATLKGASDFVSGTADKRALFEGVGTSYHVFRGLILENFDLTTAQTKLYFDTCTDVTVVDCRSRGTGTLEVGFRKCTDFKVQDSGFILGTNGDFGVGVSICEKSRNGLIDNCSFRGYIVSKDPSGIGVNPTGDRWGSVAVTIKCTDDPWSSTRDFRGGCVRVAGNTASPTVVSLPGINATDWKAWAVAALGTVATTASPDIEISATITDDTLTINQPSGATYAGIYFDVVYAYFGKTPEDIRVSRSFIDGMVNAGVSAINGINVSVVDTTMRRVADIGFDSEGCLSESVTISRFDRCNTAGIALSGRGAKAIGCDIQGSAAQCILLNGDNGGGYQSFAQTGSDYYQGLEKQDITVGSDAGGSQTLTAATGTPFRLVNIGERVALTQGGTTYSYPVTAKASDLQVTIDNTQAWLITAPRTAVTHVASAGSVAASSWYKSAFRASPYGLTGDIVVQGNTGATKNAFNPFIRANYINNFHTSGNRSIVARAVGVEGAWVTNCFDFTMDGDIFVGQVFFDTCGRFNARPIFKRSFQRSLILAGCVCFTADPKFMDVNKQPNAGGYAITYANCAHGFVRADYVKMHGQSTHSLQTQVGLYNRGGNSVDTGIDGNDQVRIDIRRMDQPAGSYAASIYS